MIDLLVYLAVFVIIDIVIRFILSQLSLPEPLQKIVLIAFVVIGVFAVIAFVVIGTVVLTAPLLNVSGGRRHSAASG